MLLFLLNSLGASGNTIGRIPGLLALPGLVCKVPLATASQPQKATFPCEGPELLEFSWASRWPSCSSEALLVCCLWCHQCAYGAWAPTHTQSSHRTARANASGGKRGPGQGDACGFHSGQTGPEASGPGGQRLRPLVFSPHPCHSWT